MSEAVARPGDEAFAAKVLEVDPQSILADQLEKTGKAFGESADAHRAVHGRCDHDRCLL